MKQILDQLEVSPSLFRDFKMKRRKFAPYVSNDSESVVSADSGVGSSSYCSQDYSTNSCSYSVYSPGGGNDCDSCASEGLGSISDNSNGKSGSHDLDDDERSDSKYQSLSSSSVDGKNSPCGSNSVLQDNGSTSDDTQLYDLNSVYTDPFSAQSRLESRKSDGPISPRSDYSDDTMIQPLFSSHLDQSRPSQYISPSKYSNNRNGLANARNELHWHREAKTQQGIHCNVDSALKEKLNPTQTQSRIDFWKSHKFPQARLQLCTSLLNTNGVARMPCTGTALPPGMQWPTLPSGTGQQDKPVQPSTHPNHLMVPVVTALPAVALSGVHDQIVTFPVSNLSFGCCGDDPEELVLLSPLDFPCNNVAKMGKQESNFMKSQEAIGSFANGSVPNMTSHLKRDFQSVSGRKDFPAVKRMYQGTPSDKSVTLDWNYLSELQRHQAVQIRESRRTEEDPEDGVKLTCEICSDKATGLHYGIITCEGCVYLSTTTNC